MGQLTEKIYDTFPHQFSLRVYFASTLGGSGGVNINAVSGKIPEKPRQHDSAKEASFSSALVGNEGQGVSDVIFCRMRWSPSG